MRVSREQSIENRERIVNTAAKLFRERGLDGIGVADLMKGAGLTHGGFYGHFNSKEDLMAEAAQRAIEQGAQEWDRLIASAPEQPLKTLMQSYLSLRHCERPGQGCAMAAIGADVARQGPVMRHAATQGVLAMVEKLANLMPGRAKAARRQQAMATYASMVGAVVLARVMDDPTLAEEMLQSVLASAPETL